jgi:hypothetical protein
MPSHPMLDCCPIANATMRSASEKLRAWAGPIANRRCEQLLGKPSYFEIH